MINQTLTSIALGAVSFSGALAAAILGARFLARRKHVDEAAQAAQILEAAKSESSRRFEEAKAQAIQARADQLAEATLELTENEEFLAEQDKALNERASQLDKLENLLNRKAEAQKTRKRALQQRREELQAKSDSIRTLQEAYQGKLAERMGSTREECIDAVMAERIEMASLACQRRARMQEQDFNENAERLARKTMDEGIQRLAFQFVKDTPAGYFQIEKPQHAEAIESTRFAEVYTEKAGVPTEWDAKSQRLVFNINHPYKKELSKRTIKAIAQADQFKSAGADPAKISVILERTERALLKYMSDETRRIIRVLGFKTGDFSADMQFYMGILKFRYSFLQNIVDHSLEVAYFSAMLGEKVGLDPKMAKRAGYLHDIGKSIDYEVEGSHPQLGEELSRKLGEPEPVWMAAGHHHDDEPENLYAAITKAADAISAARPGARKDKGDFFSERIQGIERICGMPKGVEQISVMNAGREVRIRVYSDLYDDAQGLALSKKLAEQIEDELTYPGQIHVTVIRESRAVAVAR